MEDDATLAQTSLEASFAILNGVPRHSILKALLDLGRATVAELAEHSGVGSATVARHITELEDLNIVTVDLPRGSRRGRAANISLNRDRYSAALSTWIAEMSPQKSV
ncbi:helix-turn-helix transcriptional regulator [Salinibacterium sp. G-O1]|uniref:winged helix-turn-helix transcriptional regulator n=1 Tax=Salinibacterium sp. G-O1 TaxID=3046208 RepID=UPI0024BB64E3|nr:helix-turn-helix transcriptional regulator [Salinibacterium sp. G-O1]MDJ0336602.1 helix-turn-helix transcriptional regulator [Salinibacterium sp. G-O1]